MVYMINCFEFQETNVSVSLNTNNKPQNGNNTVHSNYLRQIKPVVAGRMEITYQFVS